MWLVQMCTLKHKFTGGLLESFEYDETDNTHVAQYCLTRASCMCQLHDYAVITVLGAEVISAQD
jgi:hypothetical protein